MLVEVVGAVEPEAVGAAGTAAAVITPELLQMLTAAGFVLIAAGAGAGAKTKTESNRFIRSRHDVIDIIGY